ncbi:MAG TPA: sterol desaturase family protein [Cyclobacteriaceae bacterium]|nr:sterol desaturase family protein [Cyclobacteriaceae bacterium]
MEQLFEQTNQSNLLNLLSYVTPVFILMVAAEWVLSKIEKHDTYDARDTFANSIIGAGNVAIMATVKVAYLSAIVILYSLSPLRIPLTWWSFAICILIIDFIGYWVHRLSHESRFFWATHITHHSSEKFNYGVNFRVGWTVHIKLLFFLPLLLAGFHPVVYMISYQIDTSYQFWIHTEYIKKLPRIIELIFVTPSHHRVHHACNEKYLDRNYGVMFIVWDRLFGTFQEEDEKPRYGITTPVKSYNPVYLIFHEWMAIVRDVLHSGSIHEAWQMMFARPGKIVAIKQLKEHDKRLKSAPVSSSPRESRQLSDRPAVPYNNIYNLPSIRGSVHQLKPIHPLKQFLLIVCLSLIN